MVIGESIKIKVSSWLMDDLRESINYQARQPVIKEVSLLRRNVWFSVGESIYNSNHLNPYIIR